MKKRNGVNKLRIYWHDINKCHKKNVTLKHAFFNFDKLKGDNGKPLFYGAT